MKRLSPYCLILATFFLAAGTAFPGTEKKYSEEIYDHLGITNPDYLSAASKRALEWPERSNDWFIQFRTHDLKGDFAYEEGVVRRDPSAMIKVDGRYFVWYSRSTGETQGFDGDIETEKVFPWDRCDIWYATFEDGITWKEEGMAVPRGEKGAYDDRSVFTTEIMVHEGKYYLCYQTVKSPYDKRVKNQIGLAWAGNTNDPKNPPSSSTEPQSMRRPTSWDTKEMTGNCSSDSSTSPCPIQLLRRTTWFL